MSDQLYVFHGKREVVCKRGHGDNAEQACVTIAEDLPKYIYFYDREGLDGCS